MPGMRTENQMERRRRVSKEEGQIARIKAILGASEEIIRDGTRIGDHIAITTAKITAYDHIKPKRKKKNYVFVVTVCCQGNPFEYEYKALLTALIGYAKVYLKYSKYGTINFSLKQRFK